MLMLKSSVISRSVEIVKFLSAVMPVMMRTGTQPFRYLWYFSILVRVGVSSSIVLTMSLRVEEVSSFISWRCILFHARSRSIVP